MKTKRFLALLLSAIMCLSLFTCQVFADAADTDPLTLTYYNINASIMEFQYSEEITSLTAVLTDGTNDIEISSVIKADDPKTVVIKPQSKIDLTKTYALTVTANGMTTTKAFNFTVAMDDSFDSYADVSALESAGYSYKMAVGKTKTLSDANALDTSKPYVQLFNDEDGGKKLGLRKFDFNKETYTLTNDKTITHWYTIEATIDSGNNTNSPLVFLNRDPYFYNYSDGMFSMKISTYQMYISAFTKTLEGSNGALLQTPAGKFDMVFDAKLPSADAQSGILNMYYNGERVGRYSDIGKYRANSQQASDVNWGTSDTAKDKFGLMAMSSDYTYIDNVRVYRVNEVEVPVISVEDYSVTSQFVRISYSGAIKPDSVLDENITFKSVQNGDVAFTKSFENDNKTLVLKPVSPLDITQYYRIAVNNVKSEDGYSKADFKKDIKFTVYWNEDFDSFETLADLKNAGYKAYKGNPWESKNISDFTDGTFALVSDGNGGKKLALKKGSADYGYFITRPNVSISDWYTIDMDIDSGEGLRPKLDINKNEWNECHSDSGFSVRFSNEAWRWIRIPCFGSTIYGQLGDQGNQNSVIVPPTGKFNFVYEAKKNADDDKGSLSIYYNSEFKKSFKNLSYNDTTADKFSIGSQTNDRVQYIDNVKVYKTVEADFSNIEAFGETSRDIMTKVINVSYSDAVASTPSVTLKADNDAVNVSVQKSSDNKTITIIPETALDLYKYYELDIANVKDVYGQSADSNQKFKFNVYWDEDFENYNDINELDSLYELVGYGVSPNNVSDFHKLVKDADGNQKLQINKAVPAAGGDAWSFRKRSMRNKEELLRYCTVEFSASTSKTGGSFDLTLNRHQWSYPGQANQLSWGSNSTGTYMILGLFPNVGDYLWSSWGEAGTEYLAKDVTVDMQAYDDANDKLSVYYGTDLKYNYTNKGKFASFGNIGFSTNRTNTEYIDDIKVYDVSILADNKIYAMLTNNTVSNTAVNGNVVINNMTQSGETAMIIAAAYDAKGALLNTQIIGNQTVGTGISTIPYSVKAENAATVNVFVWTNELKPLTDSVAYWQK